MGWNVWEKVEAIRRQPEVVRRRYVFLCVLVSMAFIVGIWFLSLRESFRSVSTELPQAVEKGKELVPSEDPFDSLDSLMKQTAPLGSGGGDEKTGREYFEEQFKAQESQEEQSGISGE